MCNLKIANCNIKLMQSPGCLKDDYLAFSRAFCIVLVFLVFCSANCLSDAIRGRMAGLNNLFGLHFHNGIFLLNQSPKIVPIYTSEAVRPNPDDT